MQKMVIFVRKWLLIVSGLPKVAQFWFSLQETKIALYEVY